MLKVLVALVALSWLMKYAIPTAAIVLSVWLVRRAFVMACAYDREVNLDREARQECLIIRANYQNWLAAQGDPAGIYGHYTPVTLPLTTPLINAPLIIPQPEPPPWCDYDYDDGLTEWKTT